MQNSQDFIILGTRTRKGDVLFLVYAKVHSIFVWQLWHLKFLDISEAKQSVISASTMSTKNKSFFLYFYFHLAFSPLGSIDKILKFIFALEMLGFRSPFIGL